MANPKKPIEVNEEVKVYALDGVKRMKVKAIYSTPVDSQYLYELIDQDGKLHYYTKASIGRI